MEKSHPRYRVYTKNAVSPIEAGFGLLPAGWIVATIEDQLQTGPTGNRIVLRVENRETSGPVAELGLAPGIYDAQLTVSDGSVAEKCEIKLVLVSPECRRRRFGARYGSLEYALPVITGRKEKADWKSLWNTNEFADIVVDFDNPYKFMLWRGMAFAPCWALNNTLTSNFFVETVEPQVYRDCCEMMSDRECRYSHARIIHSSDARVVIHWRYALCDSAYAICRNYWVDEMYYVYPDGVAVRNATLCLDPQDAEVWQEGSETGTRLPYQMMSAPAGKRAFNDMEFITVNPPQTCPEDVTPPEALTLLDAGSFTHTYRWPTLADYFNAKTPPRLDEYIFRMNYRNRQAVFLAAGGKGTQIYLEAGKQGLLYVPGERVEEDRFERITDLPSDFSTYIHWPVTRGWGTTPLSDPAQCQDRPTHTFLGYANAPPGVVTQEGAVTWTWLCGMAPEDDNQLRDLARSWLYPPLVENARYERRERAYYLSVSGSGRTILPLTVNGGHSLVNPSFVLPFAAREPMAVYADDIRLEAGRVGTGVEQTMIGEETVITCLGTFLPECRINITAEH